MSTATRSLRDLMKYAGPDEYDQDGVTISKMEVSQTASALSSFSYGGRAVPPGTYHGLEINGHLWMSDTPAEIRDHSAPVFEMMRSEGDVLIHGLGLGLVVGAALRLGHSVDVVEIDQRVIDAVGPSMQQLANENGAECRIHCADAYTYKFPTGQRWAVAWHDVWIDLCTDNLTQMAKLHRRYGRRVDWQGSWGRELLVSMRRRGY